MSWKAEFMSRGRQWTAHEPRFTTSLEAQEYAKDVFNNWEDPLQWKVTESDDPVNYQWDFNKHTAVRKEEE
jgi:hypothetical protein